MESTGQIAHAAPVDQPGSVHQIASVLFPAYTVEDGNVHLAGCQLEDRLFVRLDVSHAGQPLTVYVDGDGRPVDSQTIESLGMSEIADLKRPPQPYREKVDRLVEAAISLTVERSPDGLPGEVLGTMAIWCKFVEGKLRFEVGKNSADLPFSGWARTLQPPPFVCPYTGESTSHLAATDDGRIVAADQIAACQETGRRLLNDDLATCSVTGRRALLELMDKCPVCGELVLKREMVECQACRQRVSPATLRTGQCAGCRKLLPVSKADPRMALLLDEHPPLDGWRNWKISETAAVYILTAAAWLKRLLLVVDKKSLELKYVATGNRLFSGWKEVEPSSYDYVLKR